MYLVLPRIQGQSGYMYMERSNEIVILVLRLNNLGTMSLTDHTQIMRMSSIDMGLDYNSTVMLSCKLLFATAKAIVDIGPDMPQQL